ncbi:MAG: hypothetical protein WCZ90_00355 [Melioribacteraceae bacterium]
MGQQQLLLIVLGVVIVGIAVIVGINIFVVSSSQANRDTAIADLTNLASSAQQFYKRTTASGGGGNTFTGWVIPSNVDTTVNGTYAAVVAAQTVTLIATGIEKGNNGTSGVKVTMVVGPERILSTIIDN